MTLGTATTVRVCRQHGVTLFYHLTAGITPPTSHDMRQKMWPREARTIEGDWRCGDCNMRGKLPPWIDTARDGFTVA